MRFEWPDCTRCCCCLPLRRGVIGFGYFNIVFSVLIVISKIILSDDSGIVDRFGYIFEKVLPGTEFVFDILEILFSAVLLYGAHKKIPKYIKVFFYYGVTTAVTNVLLQIIQTAMITVVVGRLFPLLWMIMIIFIGTCIQVYLLSLTWRLIKKLERAGPHHYDNKLNQIIVGSRDTVEENSLNCELSEKIIV